MTELDKELLEILVCPKSRASLIQDGDWLYSTDREARLRYAIRDGIPIMLIDEAETVDEAEFDRVVGAAGRELVDEHAISQ